MRMLIPLILLVLPSCKCIEYRDGSRSLTITNWLMDTKIGKVEGQSPDGLKITIENYDATSQALNVASEALKKIP